MKSNRSAKKPGKSVNKSFKSSKGDASLVVDDTSSRRSKKHCSRDPVASHRSNASYKSKGALKNCVPTGGTSKRDSILLSHHDTGYLSRKDLPSRNNNSHIMSEDRSHSRKQRSGSKRHQRSKSKKKKTSSQEKSERRIENFFEKEYKDMQGEVL